MLSVSQFEIRLTEKDVARMLRSARSKGGPDIRDVMFAQGALKVQLSLPGIVSLPVDVTVMLLGLHDGELQLHVRWTNMSLLPDVVKQAGLGRAVKALGLSDFWDGRGGLVIPLVYIQAKLAASFTVDTLELTHDYLHVALRDIQAVRPSLVHEPNGVIVHDDPPLAAATPDAHGIVPIAAEPSPETADPFNDQERRRYDEWRERLLQWSRSKLPPSMQAAIPWVLLIPDLSVLFGRMLLDRRLNPALRTLIGAVLVYVLSPVDLIPDPIPVAGAIDDLSLMLLTLSQLQQQGQADLVREHWSGDGEPLRVVRNGLAFLRKQFRGVLRMMQGHKLRLRRQK